MFQINIGLADTLGTTNMQDNFPISLLSDFSADSSTGYHVIFRWAVENSQNNFAHLPFSKYLCHGKKPNQVLSA